MGKKLAAKASSPPRKEVPAGDMGNVARSSRLLRPGEVALTRTVIFLSLVLDDRPVKGGESRIVTMAIGQRFSLLKDVTVFRIQSALAPSPATSAG